MQLTKLFNLINNIKLGKTLFDKVWDAHVVSEIEGGPSVLYIDRHLIHEVTSPQAFAGLDERGIKSSRIYEGGNKENRRYVCYCSYVN